MIGEDKNMKRGYVDYNTSREPLILPEYGRIVQDMVDHCMMIEDRSERQRCAESIVKIMSHMRAHDGDESSFQKKLWNHLSAMSRYELDIDYPYDIEKMEDRDSHRSSIPYPQHPIKKRHYGKIIESLASKLSDIEDSDERKALTQMIANQMKRSLGKWNRDLMNEEKILDDLAGMTDGKSSYLPGELKLISDNEILNEVQQSKPTKKKKKKK